MRNQHKKATDLFTILPDLPQDAVDKAKWLDEKVQDSLETYIKGGPEDVDNFVVEITQFRSHGG